MRRELLDRRAETDRGFIELRGRRTLETYRRWLGECRVDLTTMFEDYLAGAPLLAGAWAASRRPSFGVLLLLVAWAWVTGMITISCIDQVEATIRGTNLEPRNTDVLVVKALLFAVSVD